MSRSLLGGSAATAVAILSASLIFYAKPLVAETLAAVPSQEPQVQQTSDASSVNNAQDEVIRPNEDLVTDGTTGVRLDKETDITKGQPVLTADAKTSASRPEASFSLPARAFVATAYSLRGRTASGKQTAKGLIAADHKVLPLGTRVRLEAGSYSGEYLVADTGGAVRGHKIDIWVPSTGEAMRFGRRSVKLTVLTRTRPRTNRGKTSDN